jgi:uncharacterized repeat protein (TIGR03803 family)
MNYRSLALRRYFECERLTYSGILDGRDPLAGLVLASNGLFYGTTTIGGTVGYGTVFKMTLTGMLTTLHSFAGSHGGYPTAGLIQATDGKLYGTTTNGGDLTVSLPCLRVSVRFP